MPILLPDVRVREIPLRDNGAPLVSLTFTPAVLVRAGLADRLHALRLGQAGVDVEFRLHPGVPPVFDVIAFDTDVPQRAVADRVRALAGL
jgi:hypothetical protein